MEAVDRDALICDFAETYHIFDIDLIPIKLRATLASGLRDDSRIKMKINGMKYDILKQTVFGLYDILKWIQWSKTKDGSKNINHPESIFDILNSEKDINNDMVSVKSERELMTALYGGES